MSALRAPSSHPAPTPRATLTEVPGLAYYTPANLPAPPSHPLTALEQMYGYWSRE